MLVGLVDPHSEQQLARGFLPFWHRWSSCEVRRGSANLWYAAAKALGFDIGMIRCPDQLLIRQVFTLCAGVKSLAPLPGWLLPLQHLPDIVFSDLAGIPLGTDSGDYWGAWLTPHLFFCNRTDDSGATVAGPAAVVPPAPFPLGLSEPRRHQGVHFGPVNFCGVVPPGLSLGGTT